MAHRTVLLIGENQNDVEEIKSVLPSDKYEIVGETTDGEKGLDILKELSPDLVVTGMVLTGADGLEVISRAGGKVLVLSAISHEEIVRRAMGAGASYYLTKPLKKDVLLSRIDDIFSGAEGFDRQGRSLEERISRIFLSAGIPPHIKGYFYLREGVKIAVADPMVVNSITKKLYPMIGDKYETTPSKVERAIRHAIEVAWNRNRTDTINSVFGVRAYVGNEKPTNGEFIALVADKMILENNRA